VTAGPSHFAILSAVVFAIGVFGVVGHTGLLRSLIAVAVLFAAPLIAVVGFAQTGLGGAVPPTGNAFAVLALCAVVAEALAAAAAATLVWRRTGEALLEAAHDAEDG